MSNKQLIALSLSYAVIFSGVSSLVALMPIYLTKLGAESTLTGFFLAFAFLSLSLSNIVGGWLSDHFQSRKNLLILSGAVAAPISVIISQVTNVSLLMILMGGLFFTMGITMTMTNILAGLFADEGKRGRIFGILGLSFGTGVFMGSLLGGWIVDLWGYPTFFILLGALYLVIIASGFFLKDKTITPTQPDVASPGVGSVLANRNFVSLIVASILAQVANSIILLGKPLIMNDLHFTASAITGTIAVGSLITLPLPLVLGRLSDRLGRKSILMMIFATSTLGIIMLGFAVDLWHFWVSSVLQTAIGASLVVGSALITDIFPEAALGRSLSLFNSVPNIGIVIGLSAGGIAIRVFQMTPTLILAVLISLLAILALMPISTRGRQQRQEKAPAT